jgi:hypothetical protein
MSISLSNIKWGWVILGVVIAFLIAYGVSFLVVTGYATYLAFQVRGAPDQALINEFAATYAEIVGSIFIGVGTLVGGLMAGRKSKGNARNNGLAVGLITAIICLVLDLLGSPNLWTVVGFVLSLGGGLGGGQIACRRG